MTEITNKEEITTFIERFAAQVKADPNSVKSVYRGKDRVCRCGCRGDYAKPNTVPFRMRMKEMLNFKAEDTTSVEQEGNYFNISYGNDRALCAYFD
jgi:hypothetical protein